MPYITGNIYIDNTLVGNVTGEYIDNSASGSSTRIDNVTINISVIVDSVNIGNGSLSYQDYVTYNGGGSTTISISGSINIDSTPVGSIDGSLADTYGSIITPGSPHFKLLSYTNTVSTTVNQQFTINIQITNDGTASGTVKVLVKDQGGSTLLSREYTIDPQVIVTDTLSLNAPPSAGTYTFSIQLLNNTTNTVDDSKTITVNVSGVTPTPITPTPTPQQPQPATRIPLILLIILLLIIVVSQSREKT